MNTKIRYDLDSLELANGDFGYPITEKEVRKVNRMLELMENVQAGRCAEQKETAWNLSHVLVTIRKSSYRTDNRQICGYMPDTGNGILFR